MKNVFIKALALTCLTAVASFSAINAQAAEPLKLAHVSAEEMSRFPGMTADYVRTPHGYFHASCVQHIDQSEELQVDGNIKRADGKTRQVAACAYPHFLKNGTRVEANATMGRLPQTYNGYLQLVSATLSSGTNELTAYMTVPAAPTSQVGQTLYFFPGLEDANNTVSILQPVLGWNGYSDNGWTIASWNCCKSGTTYVGNNVTVQTGDVIYGEMINKGGQKWTILAIDETNTSLPSATLNTNGYNQTFDWVFAGALETYGVSACDQFPATGPILFAAVEPYVGGKVVSNPNWTIQPGSDSMTACTSATINNSNHVSISY